MEWASYFESQAQPWSCLIHYCLIRRNHILRAIRDIISPRREATKPYAKPPPASIISQRVIPSEGGCNGRHFTKGSAGECSDHLGITTQQSASSKGLIRLDPCFAISFTSDTSPDTSETLAKQPKLHTPDSILVGVLERECHTRYEMYPLNLSLYQPRL